MKITRALFIFFIMILLVGFIPARTVHAQKSDDIYTVKLSSSGKTVKKEALKGKRIQLVVKQGKKVIKASTVKFSSSKKKIATVNKKGIITCKKAGTTIITVKYKGKKAKLRLIIKNPTTLKDDGQDADSQDSEDDLGKQIATYACSFLGCPYVYGGNSLTKGTDSAGFVVLVYDHFGYDLRDFRSIQALTLVGRAVDFDSVKEGDIICYHNRVGIYIGGGQIVMAYDGPQGIVCRSMYFAPVIHIRRVIP